MKIATALKTPAAVHLPTPGSELGATTRTPSGFAEHLGPQDNFHQKPLHPLTPAEMTPGARTQTQPLKAFAPVAAPAALMPLGDAPFNPGRPREPKSQHDKVMETARKWVSQTFYGPMLKQMRESPFKSEMFSGGRGGQAFSTMLDQRLADHMARGADSKLVRAIARKMEARAAYQKQAAPAKPAAPAPAAGDPYQNVRIHVAPGLRA